MYFERKKVIKNTYYLGTQSVEKAFNVAYGVDRNFLFGCMISMASLLNNNLNIHFSFHIFTNYIDDDYILKIKELSKQFDTKITIYLVDCEELKKLPSTKNWSYAMYFRFLAFDFSNTKEGQILYLDADIICKNTIQELATINLGDYTAAVVRDGNTDFWQERAQFFGIAEIANGYFNSGVMLVSLKNWAKNDITKQAMEVLSNPNMQRKLTFPDQDVLNILLCKSILYLEHNYNTQISINFELQCKKDSVYFQSISDKTIFIHYIGPTKPWHEWSVYPISNFFYAAKENSPWHDYPLLKPLTSSLIRYQAKHYFHQNKWIKGTCSYVNYFLSKILRKFS